MPEQKLSNEFIDFWIDIVKSEQTKINSKGKLKRQDGFSFTNIKKYYND